MAVTARFRWVDDVAAEIVRRVLAAPPTLGAGRLVCVDGPAGSGKTTLGTALDRGFRDSLRVSRSPADRSHVRLLHMDNVFAGWTGLEAGMATVASSVVAPLRTGRAGCYRRYDWAASAFAERRVVAPCEVLVVEGVGSGNVSYADAITALIWVETPPAVRLARGAARDGEPMRGHWLAWREQEEAMFARQGTRRRADVVVDGSG